jgi:hypothetical protein
MEDFCEARTDTIDGETVGFFGVYDGMNCLELLKSTTALFPIHIVSYR